MRSRVIIPAMGLSVVALALATSFAPMANASASGPTAGASSAAGSLTRLSGTDAVCGGNTGAPSGNGIGSQNFDSSFDAYDDMGAADFGVTQKCKVTAVTAPGQFSVGGPVNATEGYIYKNAGGEPGALKCTGKGTGPGPDLTAKNWENKKGGACKLAEGIYWVSIVAQMDFGSAGQWYWNTTTQKTGFSDMWQNPGGGFGICPSWDTNLNCIGVDEDYIFTVKGKLI